jgi:hypothetical protein
MASKKTNWGNYNGMQVRLGAISPRLISLRHLSPWYMSADIAPDYSGPAKEQGSSIHVSDPRLDLLATLLPGSFTAKNCLDIGCNAGGVSCQVGK